MIEPMQKIGRAEAVKLDIAGDLEAIVACLEAARLITRPMVVYREDGDG